MRVRPPLPGPVPAEKLQMTAAERDAVTWAASHNAGLHRRAEMDCPLCQAAKR